MCWRLTPMLNALLVAVCVCFFFFLRYVLFTFAVNWGPNVSTFVLPQELFAVETRATFNGLAAAAGKTGAVAGIWTFEKVCLGGGLLGECHLPRALHSQLASLPLFLHVLFCTCSSRCTDECGVWHRAADGAHRAFEPARRGYQPMGGARRPSSSSSSLPLLVVGKISARAGAARKASSRRGGPEAESR